MSYRFKEKEILIILGAGASVEAGIPHSNKMIEDLEDLVTNDDKWKNLHDLYFYIKGTFQYGNALKKISNRSNSETYYNIESLYVALDELSKRDEHSLFPFIGAWSPKLADVAGDKFKNVKDLKEAIYDKIRDWVGVTKKEKIAYYENIFEFRKEYEFSIRIFSMNYDLCVERAWENWHSKNRTDEINLERGFYPASDDEIEKSRCWDWKRLDESQNLYEGEPVFLYKLHGSIDWKKEGEKTKFEDDGSWSNIKIDESVFIFGETNKLHYNDPFFYLFQEFRKWTLSSKLIISIGYSFADPHINNVIRQSLLDNPERKLLVVSPYGFDGGNPISEDETDDGAEKKEEKRANKVKETHSFLKLDGVCESQIVFWFYGAKAFMNDKLKIEDLTSLFPEEELDLIEEVEMNDEEIAEPDTSIGSSS